MNTTEDKAKIIESQHKELFGKEFSRHIKITAKAINGVQKTTLVVVVVNTNRRPFPRSPLSANQDGGRSYGGSNKMNFPKRGGCNSQRVMASKNFVSKDIKLSGNNMFFTHIPELVPLN